MKSLLNAFDPETAVFFFVKDRAVKEAVIITSVHQTHLGEKEEEDRDEVK